MALSWKDSIYVQREELARILREPLAQLGQKCAPVWGDRDQLNEVLITGLPDIPHCAFLYVLDQHGIQISDNVEPSGIIAGHFGRDRSQRPYMKEPMPSWGFLLSDAYIGLPYQRPSLTAANPCRCPVRWLASPHWSRIY